MIEFNYEEFPVLEWLPYKPGSEPEFFQITAVDEAGRDWMSKSDDLQTTISLFTSDYLRAETLREKMTDRSLKSYQAQHHLYLTKPVFDRVDSDLAFRQRLWPQAPKLENETGTILFRPLPHGKPGAYLYRIASAEDTRTMQQLGKLPFHPGGAGYRWPGCSVTCSLATNRHTCLGPRWECFPVAITSVRPRWASTSPSRPWPC